MSYCINPNCKQPQNPDDLDVCRFCGCCLRLHNRYRAIKLIGQGGFGRTFLAVDEKGIDSKSSNETFHSTPSTSLCSIKQFLPANFPVLFQREVQRLKDVGEHPQIPQLLDAFEQNQQFYLIQEFIDGPNLEQVLKEQGVFTETAIWRLLREMLPILQYIHDRQVIHRDIKPANIIQRSQDAQFVLVDFGAAKLLSPIDAIRTGTTIGSAEYAAPEQTRGKATFASDLYSLGVTCIYLLTGIPPFDLFDSVNDTWIWQQCLPAAISDALADVLNQLLPNALSKRFCSAAQVMQVISQTAGTASYPTAAVSHENFNTNLDGWECCYVLKGHLASVNAIAISPDGGLLATGDNNNEIRLWNLANGQQISVLTGHSQAIRSLTFHPKGSLLASASRDRTIKLWDLNTYQPIISLTGHSQRVTSVAFSPDGQILASASWDKTIKLWHSETKQELYTLTGHKLQVTAVAFAPQQVNSTKLLLASASCDRTVRIWSLQQTATELVTQLRHTLTDHVGPVLTIAFSSDGLTLATGGDDRTIKLWDVATGQLIRTLEGHSWSISALAFSDSTLVSGSSDTPLKIWHLAPSSTVTTLAGHTDSIYTVAVRSDGKLIASGSRDTTVRVWKHSSLPQN